VQRIPLSDEYDPDADFASDMDPLESLMEDDDIRLGANVVPLLPLMFSDFSKIEKSKREAKKHHPSGVTKHRTNGC
jgi:hypothetical protein